MLDKSIPYLRVIMTKEGAAPFPRFVLPPGYQFSPYRPGMEKDWAEIIVAVGERATLAAAEETFRNCFLSDPQLAAAQCLFVLDAAGKAAATASLWWGEDFGPALPRLHWVATRPEEQGKALAKALISRLLEQQIAHGQNQRLYLTSQTWSYRALALYARFGFRPYWGPKPLNWSYEGDFCAEAERAWALIFERTGGAAYWHNPA